jgi:glycerol-3-phosphate dehydrogenase (NAD(P)+)
VVSLSKGLEAVTHLRMTEVIKEVVPGHPVAALSGPNIATEIISGKAAAAVIATEDLEVARAIQKVITRGLFRVYLNDDVIGCEMGGALKNVIAIAAGIGEGLGVGDNTRAAVMSRGLSELARLGTAMGAQPSTFAGLAGMGDLIATCMSPHSRNRRVGEELGKGRRLEDVLAEMHMVAEGVNTAGVALELAERHRLDLPICAMIDRVVRGEIEPSGAYWGLTPAGHEDDPG